MSWRYNCEKSIKWANSNPKPDLHVKSGENPLRITQVIVLKRKYGCRWQITLSKIDEVSPLAIPNYISTITMHIPSLVKSIDIYSIYHPETKILTCRGQITVKKIEESCPLAIQNQISTISMHTPSLVKSIDIYSRCRQETKHQTCRVQIALSKTDEISP